MNKKDIKILLVDDEPDILEIVGYNLRNEGYQIFTAENGNKAIKSAKKNIPHLILLDIMMPEMDGIEACEKIRKIKSLESVIIAFLTARGEDYSQVAGFEAGADDYITKPIKPKVLVSKIKSLLRRLKNKEENEEIFKIGDIVIDRDEYVVYKANKKISLPRKEFDAEGNEIDPREELVQRLIEYKRYKSVIEELKVLEDNRRSKNIRGNIYLTFGTHKFARLIFGAISIFVLISLASSWLILERNKSNIMQRSADSFHQHLGSLERTLTNLHNIREKTFPPYFQEIKKKTKHFY